MGWGSATYLFDAVLDAVLEYLPDSTQPIGEREWTVYKLWTLFTDADWDSWEESNHVELLRRVLKHYEPEALGE